MESASRITGRSRLPYSTNDFSVVSVDDKLICLDFKTGETVEEFQLGLSYRIMYTEKGTKVFAAVTGKLQVGETSVIQSH